MDIEKNYNKIILADRERFKKDIETLQDDKEKYIRFSICIPDILKKLFLYQTPEEIISSIIRITKTLLSPGIIEFYVCEEDKNTLILIDHFGSQKDKGSVIKLGEGIIGLAAEKRMTISKKWQHLCFLGNIDFASPIAFKERLIGVIGVGNINKSDGNEMRFISMIADLAGIYLQNFDILHTARQEAIEDPLTGLYTRRYFFEKARDEAYNSIKNNSPISIFIFDLDDLKGYNDMHGHPEGDYLLKELSQILKENSREGDVIARYGGDEFIILMPDTDKDGAALYAEKIRKIIAGYPFRYRDKQPSGYISISGGVASFPFDGRSLSEVIKLADKALYESKRSGGNRITTYKPFQFSYQ
ncbi:MAG: diguanylate cyclase [Thermodesulfovibrionales bacterium]